MKTAFDGKKVVLGVTGSIACYKAVDLCSKLVQAGAQVDVILTDAATKFITPLTFRSITHRPVVTDIFDAESELSVEHVALAERADVVVVAPATAHTIAKLALGLADDAITTTILATAAPVVVAPAMDAHMYDNPATLENIETLKRRGITVAGPAKGRLASGLWGWGRMVEPSDLLGHIAAALGRRGDLADKIIVISAGGTQEAIDPVRVITNRSSGKMGYAIAEAARDRGAHAVLVTAPTSLPDPPLVEVHHVESALEMRDAVAACCENADALIMAAAVADYRSANPAGQKMKKGKGDTLTISLIKNPDILAETQGTKVKVGFAAETEDLLANARQKLINKNVHLFVANDVTAPGAGFGVDTNKVTIIDRDGGVEDLPIMTKYEVAHRILDRVAKLLKS
ncbi:MAG: bifunctional phosphopantothenoylcysteine decarboxylase/phosphopantothenate--cysteine ligase CoaBC [Dehalococcoidia bacterium]|nr:bifunctional phosphopantothenoylcysteine decarboxylase/phosphopantothenate--cysteine ligase CoaBC [Dehalococcoidia bacterium]